MNNTITLIIRRQLSFVNLGDIMADRKTIEINKSLINDTLGRIRKDSINYLHADGMNFIYDADNAALYLHKNDKGLLLSFISIEGFWHNVKKGTICKERVKNHLENCLNGLSTSNIGANTRALMNYMYHHYFQQN